MTTQSTGFGAAWPRPQIDASRITCDSSASSGRSQVGFSINASALAVPDRQGRVMVPSTLIESARLSREVVVAGVDDHLEIWDRVVWREQLRELEGSVEDAAERLAERA